MTTNDEPSDLVGVRERVRAWRHAHPGATLTEIERELDHQFHAARAAMLAEVASAESADLGACPDCGGRLLRRGEHERTLTTSGDEALTLQRPYATCARCGRGLFPPG